MEERWKFMAAHTTRVASGKGAVAALGERGRVRAVKSLRIESSISFLEYYEYMAPLFILPMT